MIVINIQAKFTVLFRNVKSVLLDEHVSTIIIIIFSAPFTVQRLCELVTQPKKHYTQCDKFLRGIEKVRV